MLYHVEFKSKIDNRWIGAWVGHSLTEREAEEAIERRKVRYPDTEYRVAPGAYPFR